MTLNNAFPFLNNPEETFVKVREEIGGLGVRPGALNKVYYSEEKNDINGILNLLKGNIIKPYTDDLIEGGSYFEYCFYDCENNIGKIRIENGIISFMNVLYELQGEYCYPLESKDGQIYSLLTYKDNFTVYKDEESVGHFNKVKDLEFKIIPPLSAFPVFHLVSSLIELLIYDAKQFSLVSSTPGGQNQYFHVVGDVDFASLFKK